MESATLTENSLSEVEMALKKCKNHPSIAAITKRNFSFLATLLADSISSHMTIS